MRKSLAVLLSAGVLLGWWFSAEVTVLGQQGNPRAGGSGDVNGDRSVDLADAIYLLNYVFQGGPEPVPLAAAEVCDFSEQDCAAAGTFTAVNHGTLPVEFSFGSLVTLTPGGGYVTESDLDFGAGGGGPFAFRSSGRGNWKRTGEREFTATYLHYTYDPAGALAALEKVTTVLSFDDSFESAHGVVTFSVYAPHQDPFGDDPPLVLPMGAGEMTLRRMPVE